MQNQSSMNFNLGCSGEDNEDNGDSTIWIDSYGLGSSNR